MTTARHATVSQVVAAYMIDAIGDEQHEALSDADWQALPELQGTDKQVAWAATIRDQRNADIDRMLADADRRANLDDVTQRDEMAKLRVTCDLFLLNDSAAWWIETRDQPTRKLMLSATTVKLDATR